MAGRARTMTSIIGMPTRNDRARVSQAFTLVELILVMLLLATLLALSAPTILHSFKQRDLEKEATQLLAVTEYARSEAVSQGVPMTVWVRPETGEFGVQASDGYDGEETREKTYTLGANVHFDPVDAAADQNGHTLVAIFDPEGTLDPESSVAAMRLVNRAESGISVEQTDDGWGYEIVKEEP